MAMALSWKADLFIVPVLGPGSELSVNLESDRVEAGGRSIRERSGDIGRGRRLGGATAEAKVRPGMGDWEEEEAPSVWSEITGETLLEDARRDSRDGFTSSSSSSTVSVSAGEKGTSKVLR